MKVKPLGDRVIIQPSQELEKTKGGILVPDSAKEKPQQGKVIAVGEGKKSDEGKVIPLSVKTGDTVLYGKYSGTNITIDDQEYLIVREDEIVAIVG
jgi:chaperonin GroES